MAARSWPRCRSDGPGLTLRTRPRSRRGRVPRSGSHRAPAGPLRCRPAPRRNAARVRPLRTPPVRAVPRSRGPREVRAQVRGPGVRKRPARVAPERSPVRGPSGLPPGRPRRARDARLPDPPSVPGASRAERLHGSPRIQARRAVRASCEEQRPWNVGTTRFPGRPRPPAAGPLARPCSLGGRRSPVRGPPCAPPAALAQRTPTGAPAEPPVRRGRARPPERTPSGATGPAVRRPHP